MHRRDFLATVSSAAVASSAAGLVLAPRARAAAKDLANSRVTVCVAGLRGRGSGLLAAFAALPGVEVKYVCDIDSEVLARQNAELASRTGRKAEAIADYRRALDDDQVQALVLGTPDHWHALPTIHACQAGKDVYCEKPDGHNLLEGRTMVAAAKKHQRVVQLGMQARSCPEFFDLMDYIRAGNLGKPLLAKAWESTRQTNLGHPADGTAPSTIDYDTWLGAAPKRAFNPLRYHGNWRWFLDYGCGDLGNDGVHRIDMARWALETAIEAAGEEPLGLPRGVSASGGKYYFDDAQEWPDTQMVTYDFPGRVMTYELRIWSPYKLHEEGEGAACYGDQGFVILGNNRWRAFDAKGELVKEVKRGDHTSAHAQNFIDCMQSRARPAADLETVGHPSSILCHLGNAAWRAGRTLRFDPATYTFTGDDDANQYITRSEYRKPFVLPSLSEV